MARTRLRIPVEIPDVSESHDVPETIAGDFTICHKDVRKIRTRNKRIQTENMVIAHRSLIRSSSCTPVKGTFKTLTFPAMGVSVDSSTQSETAQLEEKPTKWRRTSFKRKPVDWSLLAGAERIQVDEFRSSVSTWTMPLPMQRTASRSSGRHHSRKRKRGEEEEEENRKPTIVYSGIPVQTLGSSTRRRKISDEELNDILVELQENKWDWICRNGSVNHVESPPKRRKISDDELNDILAELQPHKWTL